MPKLPRISSKEAIRTLERMGFYQIRQTGSHVIMKKQTINGEVGCVVPLHPELKVGTFFSGIGAFEHALLLNKIGK